ncbi:MAG: hypothetical protein AAFY46_05755 [Planctomycetota bacterium]
MLITVDNVVGNDWRVSAAFVTQPPVAIGQVWADTSFDLTGDGSPISITAYTPVYDTALADAVVSNGEVASFRAINGVGFFGPTDSGNPQFVVDFEYAGSFDALELTLVGQNAALLNFFTPTVLYQDAAGNPGELTWDVQYIPAPATLALAPVALMATRRSRKET